MLIPEKEFNHRIKHWFTAFILSAGPAFTTVSSAQIADNGLYLGAGIGGTTYQGFDGLCRDLTGVLPGIPVDADCEGNETALGWKLFGGWRFNRYLALEGGYANLGDSKGNTVILGQNVNGRISATTLFADLVGSLPLGNDARIFGKMGMAGISSKLTTDTFATILSTSDMPRTTYDDNSTEITYGIGVEYGFTKNIIGRVEWERFALDDGIDLISGSLVFPLNMK